jgi:IS30 family transposase
MKIVRHEVLQKEVAWRLLDDQSPQAIAGYLSRYGEQPLAISKDSIYRFIKSPYGRRLETHRWLSRQRHRKQRLTKKKLENRVFIDKRPDSIGARKRIGHAEADFIVSGKTGKGVLLVVVDRRSRVVCIERIIRVTIPNVQQAFLRIKARFPELRTLTMDNDILFTKHELLAKLLQVRIFFCHPYHSWEKGTVENANKVIRRDIPKGSDLSKKSKRFIERLEAKLNRRPMKCLDYRTPREVLDRYRERKNKKHRLHGCPN